MTNPFREPPWRVGRKVPRNIYLNDEPIAMLATAELAASIVGSLNEVEHLRAELEDFRAALVAVTKAECCGCSVYGEIATRALNREHDEEEEDEELVPPKSSPDP